jgi:hypothetical protein
MVFSKSSSLFPFTFTSVHVHVSLNHEGIMPEMCGFERLALEATHFRQIFFEETMEVALFLYTQFYILKYNNKSQYEVSHCHFFGLVTGRAAKTGIIRASN